MRKTLGLAGFLLAIIVLASLWEVHKQGHIVFLSGENLRGVLTFVGLYGILSLGQALVIISGGIDLSVGSLVGLVGVSAALLMNKGQGLPAAVVLPGVLVMAGLIGAWHGFLVTKVRIQPFVVTLCGLFFYRGLARLITGDQTQGFGTAYRQLKWLGRGFLPSEDSLIAVPLVIYLFLALLVGVYLHLTPPGRHLLALGANPEAARFSGIRTHRLIILAYVLCSLLTGVGALLMAFKVNSLQPTGFGSFYELYAIAGAVLGGCSLRGGVGNVFGVVLGASLIVVLQNLVNILGIPSQLEYVVIGGAILAGICVDELFTRRATPA